MWMSIDPTHEIRTGGGAGVKLLLLSTRLRFFPSSQRFPSMSNPILINPDWPAFKSAHVCPTPQREAQKNPLERRN